MGINLKFPLRAYRRGFFEMNHSTLNAVREDIKILLLTKKGERVVNSGIGTNIPILAGQLFEPTKKETMVNEIGSEIRSALSDWMPYVTLSSIKVFDETDAPAGYNIQRSQVLILMDYSLNDASGLNDSIALTINSAPR